MSNTSKIHIITSVWGKNHTDTFLKICLPSLFAKNNLKLLKNKKNIECIYKIYTTKKNAFLIEKSQSYQKLTELINVQFKFISIKNFKNVHSYEIMNHCHKNSIGKAYKNNAVLIFINADTIFSNNFFMTILSLLEKGYRAICVASIRLAKQNFINFIKNNYEEINFHPRKLVKIASQFFHPISNNLFWNSKKIPTYCADIYWKIDSENLILRSFFLHPICIWPEKEVELKSNIDGYFIEQACPSPKKRTIIQDSDHGVVYELTDQNLHVLGDLRMRNISYLAWWSKTYTHSIHWDFMKTKIYFKSDRRKYHWKKIEKKSDKIFYLIKKRSKNNIYNNIMIFLFSGHFSNLKTKLKAHFDNKFHLLLSTLKRKFKQIIKF